MNLAVQKNRFQLNWETFSPHFPIAQWEKNNDFLYFVEIKLEATAKKSMQSVIDTIKTDNPDSSHWVEPNNMSITIALPGRLGVHFQGNDVNNMKKQLSDIFARFNQFEIVLGRLNCFSNVLFREVYDASGHLPLMHYQICQAIPFAQAPEFSFENFLPHVSLFYAEKGAQDMITEDFDRELPDETMTVKKIIFGQAWDEETEIFKKETIQEFKLKPNT